MDYQLEDTVFLPFTTRAFATGIPTVLAGTPAIDIYEDATATPIVTGETLVVSLNSVVGFNMITVTATAATGFNVGGHYTAIIQAGTVDSVSVVGEVVAEFTIDNSAAAKDLANGTDGLGAIKADTGEIGTAGAGLTNINLPNQTMDIVGSITGNLSGSVGSVTGAVGSVTAQVSADVTAISGDGPAADNLELDYDGTGYDKVNSTIGTTTVNTDMRGTDNAATATAMATAQADLDTLTGADGAVIASAQGPVTFTGGTNEAGITVVGQGTGAGLKATAGATGHGVEAVGGATSGDGIHANADGAGNGMDLVGVGGNAGMRTEGGATGAGIHAHGGATGATPGVEFHAHSATGDALELEVDGTGDTNADLVAIQDDTAEIGIAGAGLTDLGGFSTGAKAEINAEVSDVWKVDTIPLPGQETPPTAPTFEEFAGYVFKYMIHQVDNDGTTIQVYNAASSVVDQKAAVSESAGTVTRDKFTTGP